MPLSIIKEAIAFILLSAIGYSCKQKRITTKAKQLDLFETLQEPDYWGTRSISEKCKLFRWLVKDVIVRGEDVRVELDV